MRIVVHDYSGHPFQVQLSRELARMGNEVLHLHFASFQTPKGPVQLRPGDPAGLTIEGICLSEPFCKYGNFIRRRRQEVCYGHMAARRMIEFQPDVVLSANTPLDAQSVLQNEAKRAGARFVFWLQDVYSEGIATFLRKRKFPGAAAIGSWYRALEGRLLRSSDAVVAISHDFLPSLAAWKVDSRRVRCIENWAPVDELPSLPQDNLWSRQQGLAGRFVYLYAGTLGLKHEPQLLIDLAQSLAPGGDAVVAVVSGDASRLPQNEPNLVLYPSQPWERMPEVLASGSVLVALLDSDSGAFSVPSKVLSYLCAERPLLLSVPERNAAARVVLKNRAGLVVPPENPLALATGAHRLAADARLCAAMAIRGRAYAERAFDIARIAEQFLPVLQCEPNRASAALPAVLTAVWR